MFNAPHVATEVIPRPLSIKVDSSRQFPHHLNLLSQHLIAQGENPDDWQTIHAAEVRLDEQGMEVAFWMRRQGTTSVLRHVVLVAEGRLIAVRTETTAAGSTRTTGAIAKPSTTPTATWRRPTAH